jgi:hypothetical protein
MTAAWFVSANNKLFGPYSHEQMKDFALQKRVGPQSLVRLGHEGNFITASAHAALAKLFEAAPTVSSSATRAEATAGHPVAGMADGETSNFVVIVDFRMGSVRQFETELKTLGRVFRMNGSTWLLQSDRSSNTIKTTLAPYVGHEDPLLIIDCGRNRMAWHNMGVFEASSIRDLWKLPHERN